MDKITKLPNGGEFYEDFKGNKSWYLHDKPHREDGPALDYVSGNKFWYINGKRHREDGPAAECVDGEKYWFLNGQQIVCETQDQFERLLKLKAFW
jgi:hypothetical protein